MKNFTANELRKAWLNFYISKGHKDIGSASLIPENDTSVLFTTAGMHPIVRYLLGESHPFGKRLCNIQKCIRTGDIDEVGDNCHLTFFEMLGNWSLGDYFKKEKMSWTFEFLTKVLKLNSKKIETTVFAGNDYAPRDDDAVKYAKELGITDDRIHFEKDNWWGLGTNGTPCGPDNEWFYPAPNGKLVEIGNDVYMQYVQISQKEFKEKEMKCVDTGFGFERILAFINNLASPFATELFADAIIKLENLSGKKYFDFPEDNFTRSFRIVADHTRATVAILGDNTPVFPSNKDAGYVLRRLIRKAILHIRRLGVVEPSKLCEIASIFIENFKDVYPEFLEHKDLILNEINKEENRFLKTIEAGEKEFEKLISSILKKEEFFKQQGKTEEVKKEISGKAAFRLYDTFGFPLELTISLAQERGFTVNREEYETSYKQHQELARTANVGQFKGGLSSFGEMETKYHTTTHLLHVALMKILKSECKQAGSNITAERLRFDFTFERKMTVEEIKLVEDLVNSKITEKLPIEMKEMTVEQAKKRGAIGVFDSKYANVVKVYTILDPKEKSGFFSSEICGGPHVKNTSELGKFKIIKEESCSAGVRRIKAVLT